jgi:signal transduction histidine kinase
MRPSRLQNAGYIGVVTLCCILGFVLNGKAIADRTNNYAYDLTDSMATSIWGPTALKAQASVVVAIDEATLRSGGEMQNIRPILAQALTKINAAHPAAVALDVTLASEVNPEQDSLLEAALRATPNLVLPSGLDSQHEWEDPAPRFKTLAVALGHIHPEVNRLDGVSRRLPLEQIANGQRRWALSLEAFRVAHHAEIMDSPDDVAVGSTVIPAPRKEIQSSTSGEKEYDGRPMLIRYLPPGGVPKISVLDIDQHRDEIRDKAVFLGVTALTAANDRLIDPAGDNVPGVEVHAHAYETMLRGDFLRPPSNTLVMVICVGVAVAVGLIFAQLSGFIAYALGFAVLIVAHLIPLLTFHQNIVFPYVTPAAVAWLTFVGAATYQHFVVRRTLGRTESERARYQQAIHWAVHEMRTPLTAIQGSSELMSRYKLSEDKRLELSNMINSESKRLAKTVQTFLDVERLTDGQVELKREPFTAADVVHVCLLRVTPLAERKNIEITLDTEVNGSVVGDRELVEYAIYNLLTNAVKYSPTNTHVRVRSELRNSEFSLSVQDEGIGMDAKELKNIFRKFYRTKRAEASGEVGTGIGLSIVEQIISRHGGRIEVTSVPGKGSCFTMVLAARTGVGISQ